jgi:hypothetical protein
MDKVCWDWRRGFFACSELHHRHCTHCTEVLALVESHSSCSPYHHLAPRGSIKELQPLGASGLHQRATATWRLGAPSKSYSHQRATATAQPHSTIKELQPLLNHTPPPHAPPPGSAPRSPRQRRPPAALACPGTACGPRPGRSTWRARQPRRLAAAQALLSCALH